VTVLIVLDSPLFYLKEVIKMKVLLNKDEESALMAACFKNLSTNMSPTVCAGTDIDKNLWASLDHCGYVDRINCEDPPTYKLTKDGEILGLRALSRYLLSEFHISRSDVKKLLV
jgi:hypothetical protein